MMTKVVRLHFCSPVHFGDGRLSDGECTCAADTLFSALFIEALAQGVAEELLAAVQSKNLLISDAFPWIGDTYYLPKPRVVLKRASDEDEDDLASSVVKKAFKQLSYIPQESYAAYFDGTLDPVAMRDKLQSELGSGGLVTKVNLMREHRDKAEPYHVGGFRFSDDAGLYFLVRDSYDLKPLLDALQYSGLGGKRSSGYGRFEYEMCENETKLGRAAAPHEFNILLSSAAPTEAELSDELLDDASYLLKKRSGFVQSSNYTATLSKKRDFFTFAAGSTFKHKFNGDVFDVGNGGAHPVWRYAKAFWMEG